MSFYGVEPPPFPGLHPMVIDWMQSLYMLPLPIAATPAISQATLWENLERLTNYYVDIICGFSTKKDATLKQIIFMIRHFKSLTTFTMVFCIGMKLLYNNNTVFYRKWIT